MIENKLHLKHAGEDKVIFKFWRVICFFPWVWLIALTLFAFGVAIQVGHLPSYGHPDPKNIGWLATLYIATMFSLPLLFVSIPIWGILGVAMQWMTPYRFRWQDVILYLIGLLICFWVAFTDFAGLLTWLAY